MMNEYTTTLVVDARNITTFVVGDRNMQLEARKRMF
jgi:hypothetical protein